MFAQEDIKRSAIIGNTGTGKSFFFLKSAKQIYDLKQQKILILCQNNPKTYAGVRRRHTYDELMQWKSGISLFWDYDNDIEVMMQNIMKLCRAGHIRNGAVVFEDITSYVDKHPQKFFKEFYVNHRSFYLDLYLITHGLKMFPLWFRKTVSTITLFRTDEMLGKVYMNPNKFDSLDYARSEQFHECFLRVAEASATDRHYCETFFTGL